MNRIIVIILLSLIGLQARSENFSIDSTRFRCTIHDALILADRESVSCMLDGEKITMDLPEGMFLKGIQPLGDGLAAIAENKSLLFWDSPYDKARTITISSKGELIDISSFDDRCYALTDSAEIISISIARQIKILDFNKEYAGFYGHPVLVSIAAGASSVYVTGIKTDGRPAVFTSSKGNVWSERELTWLSDGRQYSLDKKPISISYDSRTDTFILFCEDNILFYLPACSHCNRYEYL